MNIYSTVLKILKILEKETLVITVKFTGKERKPQVKIRGKNYSEVCDTTNGY